MAEWYCIVYMYHIFLIHSSLDGHIGCCYVLAIVNTAAKIDVLQISIQKKNLNSYKQMKS